MNLVEIGRNIYNMDNPREVRRMVVFVIRAFFHNSQLEKLNEYFHSNDILSKFIEEKPFPIEQVTRAFFYKGSTFKERVELVKQNYTFWINRVKDAPFLEMNGFSHSRKGYTVWEQEFEGIGKLSAIIIADGGQRKEGLCSVILELSSLEKQGKDYLYQVIFWIAKDKENKDSIYIGAMQGPNMESARDMVKKMTKACHGYRTKNLILYIVQSVAQNLGVERIYAVTNEGYYANNHMRIDRKLKTSFSDFWDEIGGVATEDNRFYSIPLKETRKSYEEIPTRKRAIYRRRFALLDEISNSINNRISEIIR